MQLSLAQTAACLLSAGRTEHEPARELPTDSYLVTLTGARAPVQVIGPPGRTEHLTPSWSGTTELGADVPNFLCN